MTVDWERASEISVICVIVIVSVLAPTALRTICETVPSSNSSKMCVGSSLLRPSELQLA